MRYLIVLDSQQTADALCTEEQAEASQPQPEQQHKAIDAHETKSEQEDSEEHAPEFSGLQDPKQNVAGFLAFRIDMDHNRQVVYMYELQVADGFRGERIGSRLVQCLEVVARHLRIDMIVCTCLKANKSALRFYMEHQGFTIDETSISETLDDDDGFSYLILSKKLE